MIKLNYTFNNYMKKLLFDQRERERICRDIYAKLNFHLKIED